MDDTIIDLAKLVPSDVLYADDKHFKLDSAQKQLELIVESAKQATQNPGYWDELPTPEKQQLVNDASALLTTVSTIRENRDDATWLAANLESYKNAISSYYTSLYKVLVSGIREYGSAHATQRQEAERLISELRTATKEARKSHKLASEASSTISTVELSKHFEDSAVGELGIKNGWRWFKGSDYQADSRRWFLGVTIAILATGVTAYFAFKGVDYGKITLNEVLARALFLTAPAYAIKFCARNYSVSKHLQSTNSHRAVVMKTLLAFLQREEISSDVRATIISEAASQAFRQPEFTTYDEKDNVIEVPVPWKKG